MSFTKTSQKFGQWTDNRANTVYGLGFSSEQELNKVYINKSILDVNIYACHIPNTNNKWQLKNLLVYTQVRRSKRKNQTNGCKRTTADSTSIYEFNNTYNKC